jgi:uncharacterized membrane protein
MLRFINPALLPAIDGDTIKALNEFASDAGCWVLVGAIVAFLMLVFMIFCHWRICSKAGYSGAMSLLLILPVIGGLIILLVLTFGKWSVNREKSGGEGGD